MIDEDDLSWFTVLPRQPVEAIYSSLPSIWSTLNAASSQAWVSWVLSQAINTLQDCSYLLMGFLAKSLPERRLYRYLEGHLLLIVRQEPANSVASVVECLPLAGG